MVNIDIETKSKMKRHGSCVVPSVIKAQTKKVLENNQVALTWTDPEDTIVNSKVVASWGGTLIVKKEGSYPEDEKDGEVVVDNTIAQQYKKTPYIDENVENPENTYYKAFPYSTSFRYQLNDKNEFKNAIIYEFTINPDDSNPATRVKYPEGCMNEDFKPAYMDFSNDKFVWGDWENAFFMPRPVMVSFDGRVEQELDVNNYKKTKSKMTEEEMSSFVETCKQVHSDFPASTAKKGTWEHEGITYDRQHNSIIITRPDSKYNLICIAPKDKFTKDFLELDDVVATTLPNRIRTLLGVSTLAINSSNTNIITAITNAGATGVVGTWLDQLKTYLENYVLNTNTATTCYVLGTRDFVILIAEGAETRGNYKPSINNGTLDATSGNALKQQLYSATNDLYQDKNSIYSVKALKDNEYKLNLPTLWGTIKENDGIISGFSSTNWASFTKPFSPEGNWELAVKFKLDKLGVDQNIVTSNVEYETIKMRINSKNQLFVEVYKNNADTHLFDPLTSVEALTTEDIKNEFIAKATYNTETGYYFEIKSLGDDGKTISVTTDTTDPITPGYGIMFGMDCKGIDAYYAYPLQGYIDIKDSYIKYQKNGEEVYYWKGKEDFEDLKADSTEVDGKYYLTNYIPKEEKWLPAEQIQPCINTFIKAYNLLLNYDNLFTSVSNVDNPDYAGNAMVAFPQVWFKFEVDEKFLQHVYIANKQVDESYHCWTHINKFGRLVDEIFIMIYQPFKDTTYKGTTNMPLLRSISGQKILINNNGNDGLAWAANNNMYVTGGANWDYMDYSMYQMVPVLLTLIGRSTNSQTTFGYGRGSSANATTGEADEKGLFYGTSANGMLKIFGIENFYGNYWKRINGCCYSTTDGLLIKMTETTQDGTTVSGYNTTGDGYLKDIGTMTGSSGGYASQAKLTENGIFPISTTSGSATTYFCDGFWWRNLAYAQFGGSNYDNTLIGCYALNLDTTITYESQYVSNSLSCKPSA